MEEARFILKNLQRTDVLGEPIQLSEAERVLGNSVTLPFSDYIGFLNKYGYVRVDSVARVVAVTDSGKEAANTGVNEDFRIRLERHFKNELQPHISSQSLPRVRTELGSGADLPANSLVNNTLTRKPRTEQRMEDVLDRRYRRGQLIGQGAIGSVYSGTHVGLKKPVAIKEVRSVFQYASYLRRDEIVKRLRDSIEAHAKLVHPNIIQISDQNPEREYPYFVMDLATGGNLRDRIKAGEGGRLDVALAVSVLIQMVYAVKFAHDQGILHLALKPENILFDSFGNIKITDFGFARILENPDTSGVAPVIVGGRTVGYFPPERLQNEACELTTSADVYAIGMIFYEMLTGKLPGRRAPLPSDAREGVPKSVDEVFDRMTRDELDERYRDMSQVLGDLLEAFGTEFHVAASVIPLWANDPQPITAIEIPDASDEIEPITDHVANIDSEPVLSAPSQPTPAPMAASSSVMSGTGSLVMSGAGGGTLISAASKKIGSPPPPPEE